MNKKDINIKIDNYTLNCRVVGIIQNNNKILLQKRDKDKYWALPGGKIQVGENTSTSLDREIKEELGITKYKIEDICTVSEHFFEFSTEKVHQYIFGHKIFVEGEEYIYKYDEFQGIEKEKNVIFKWFDINNLNNIPLKPDFLKTQLDNLDKQNIQFTSYKEK